MSRAELPGLVCWDLLGTVMSTYQETKDGIHVPRPNIAEAVRELSDSGFRSVLTTTADHETAIRYLETAEINPALFAGIFKAEVVDKRYKLYQDILDQLGADESVRFMTMVVGDEERDQSGDSELPFVYQPGGNRTDALIVPRVAELLRAPFDGNLLAGFHYYFDTLTPIENNVVPVRMDDSLLFFSSQRLLKEDDTFMSIPRIEVSGIPSLQLVPTSSISDS